MLNLRSYMLDCRQCAQLFFLPEDGDAALERHGWQRHEKGGWRCPLCRARTLDQLIDEHKRRIVGLVIVSLIAGVFLYLLK